MRVKLFYICLRFLMWLFNGVEVVVAEKTIASVYPNRFNNRKAIDRMPVNMALSRGDVFIYVGKKLGYRAIIEPPPPLREIVFNGKRKPHAKKAKRKN